MGAFVPSGDDLIKTGALRTTMATGIGAGVVAIGTAIKPVFDTVVGEDAEPWVRAMVLVSAVLAWGLVAGADLLARAYATAHAQPQIVPAPEGMKAKTAAVGTDPEWRIAALKFTPNTSEVEYLAVRTHGKTAWRKADELEFN